MPKLQFDLIHEDEHMVVINKPAGTLTLPDRHDEQIPSLRTMLEQHYGKIWVVHRLDKDTSGVIVFAKNETAHRYLSQLFESREVEKYYQGIVIGRPSQETGTINEPIAESTTRPGVMVINKRGKASVTDYQVLRQFRTHSLMEFRIHTGRTHQIRIHCKHIGHPLVCDELYGDGKPLLLSAIKKKFKLSKHEEEERPLINRVALHAGRLSFKDMEGKTLLLEAPLPKDLHAALKQLEKHA